MSEQLKREVGQHLAFAVFFIAGLLATDLFMGEPLATSNRFPTPAQMTGRAESGVAPIKPIRRTSYRAPGLPAADSEDPRLVAARRVERQRVEVIQRVLPAVVSVFGLEREGGGSGVIIHPSGLALTNHHVLAAAGAVGWGGLADGQLYRWELVGNDPGGDLALIRLIPTDPEQAFPFVRMGNSDEVQVGDWTLVMGNPFTLAEDYRPTVTHGIVSGVKRYQPGMSDTLLVYGNCIQVDTSINPGNSGGPLFDMRGHLIGINGRASFEFRQRGRVNVGLGYAISVNQCRNFLPELMATKLIQHGTLDALFGDRDGRVLCTAIYDDAEIGSLGLALGDELLEFEGERISTANQFTNLICTLPAGWPAHLKIRKSDGRTTEIRMRLLGLPYPKMDAPPPAPPPNPESPPDVERQESPPGDVEGAPLPIQKQIEVSRQALFEFMNQPPGLPQNSELNQEQAQWLWRRWPLHQVAATSLSQPDRWRITERWTTATGETGDWIIEIQREQAMLEARWVTPEPSDQEFATPLDWTKLDPSGLIADANGRLAHSIRYRDQQWEVGTRGPGDTWTWQAATETQLLRSPLGLQLWFLAQLLKSADGSVPQIDLHGADRVDQQVTARLQIQGSSQSCFCWLSLDDWTAPPSAALLKIATDINGRSSGGACRLAGWNLAAGFPWPHTRSLVRGLFEDEFARIETHSVESIPAILQ
jgi:serine protease Do